MGNVEPMKGVMQLDGEAQVSLVQEPSELGERTRRRRHEPQDKKQFVHRAEMMIQAQDLSLLEVKPLFQGASHGSCGCCAHLESLEACGHRL